MAESTRAIDVLLKELVTARRFGGAIYPSLKLADSVRRGGIDHGPWLGHDARDHAEDG